MISILICFVLSLSICNSALVYGADISVHIAPQGWTSVSLIKHEIIGGIEIELQSFGNQMPNVLNSKWNAIDADIYYTLDGTEPINGNGITYEYRGKIRLTNPTTYIVRALAVNSLYKKYVETKLEIKVEQLSTPQVTSLQSDGITYVNIFADEDATIYYTTDLTTPTTKSTKYTKEISLTDNARIKAIAVKKGYATSNVAQDYVTVEEIIKFTCFECRSVLSDTVLYGENGKAMCEACYKKQNITENETELLTECNICGDEIATDDVVYDESNQPICKQCADELSKDKEQYIELKCPHCSEILEITEDEYNECESVICPDCMKFIIYKGEDTEYECFDCGETFYYSETRVVENGKIYCPYCNEIVDGDNLETETECYICGEYFNFDDMLYDDDDNLICQDCYAELQNEDEELIYLECPYCEEMFEDIENIYDEDGYAVCPYCEGLIDTLEENTEEPESKFITSDWAAEEVYEAYQNNLIPEEMLEDTLYDTITREEFAAVAVKLYENIVGEAPYVDIDDMPFTDCDHESEYLSYIAIAYELGITKGTSETTFSPYDNISREQLATMLYRVIKLAENDKIYDFDVNNVRKFYDDSEISAYAKESVYFMAEYGIVKGVDGAHFAPLDTATKEQSILISVRCVNSIFEY